MNINTTYLLTGAAGFLGINICTQLIERSEHIRAFVLKGDPARKYLPAEVEVFEGDLCSAEDCEAFFNIPEGSQSVCIHCASMVTIDPGYSEKLIAVKRNGKPEEIAALYALLLDERLGYLTGTDIVMDGGVIASGVSGLSR